MASKGNPQELELRIEAILFAGGKPLSVGEMAEVLGEGHRAALQEALATLMRRYADRPTALELRKVGDRYALQLRDAYVTVARPVTPLDMSPRTLKSLTLIAYHQPLLQSLLVRMIGDGAYEEVQRLRGMGFVHTEPKGSTLELVTTRLFAEHFGIGSTRPEEIRQYLERKLGVPSPPPAATGDGGPTVPPPPAAEDASVPPSPEGAEAPTDLPDGTGSAPAEAVAPEN